MRIVFPFTLNLPSMAASRLKAGGRVLAVNVETSHEEPPADPLFDVPVKIWDLQTKHDGSLAVLRGWLNRKFSRNKARLLITHDEETGGRRIHVHRPKEFGPIHYSRPDWRLPKMRLIRRIVG